MSSTLFGLFLAVAQTPPAAPAPSASAPQPLAVPAGRAPVLDGKVELDEWRDAAVIARAGAGTGDEVQLLAKHAAGKLYLGVRVAKPAITTLALARDEKHIVVFHASQALGAVDYRLDTGAWKRGADFTWRCKDAADTEPNRTERREHLEQQNWYATTMKMGLGQAEFALAKPFVESAADGTTTVRLALSLFGASVFRAPEKLADGVKNTALQMGSAPAELAFAPKDWLVLRLEPAPPPAAEPTKR